MENFDTQEPLQPESLSRVLTFLSEHPKVRKALFAVTAAVPTLLAGCGGEDLTVTAGIKTATAIAASTTSPKVSTNETPVTFTSSTGNAEPTSTPDVNATAAAVLTSRSKQGSVAVGTPNYNASVTAKVAEMLNSQLPTSTNKSSVTPGITGIASTPESATKTPSASSNIEKMSNVENREQFSINEQLKTLFPAESDRLINVLEAAVNNGTLSKAEYSELVVYNSGTALDGSPLKGVTHAVVAPKGQSIQVEQNGGSTQLIGDNTGPYKGQGKATILFMPLAVGSKQLLDERNSNPKVIKPGGKQINIVEATFTGDASRVAVDGYIGGKRVYAVDSPLKARTQGKYSAIGFTRLPFPQAEVIFSQDDKVVDLVTVTLYPEDNDQITINVGSTSTPYDQSVVPFGTQTGK